MNKPNDKQITLALLVLAGNKTKLTTEELALLEIEYPYTIRANFSTHALIWQEAKGKCALLLARAITTSQSDIDFLSQQVFGSRIEGYVEQVVQSLKPSAQENL